MDYKVINRKGRTFRVYEDGSVQSLAFKDKRGRNISSRMLKPSELPNGYFTYIITINGKCHNFTAHRFVAEAFCEGYSNDCVVDHADGDRKNNHHSNLRCGTLSSNMRGHVARRKGVSSKYRGVHRYKKSNLWVASVHADNHVHYLGMFKSEEAAALAYNTKAIGLGFQPEALNQIAA